MYNIYICISSAPTYENQHFKSNTNPTYPPEVILNYAQETQHHSNVTFTLIIVDCIEFMSFLNAEKQTTPYIFQLIRGYPTGHSKAHTKKGTHI